LRIHSVLQFWVEVIAVPLLSLLNEETTPVVCLQQLQICRLLGIRALILLVSRLVPSGIPYSNSSMNVGIFNVVQIHRHPSLLPFHLFHLKITISLHSIREFYSVDLQRRLKLPAHQLEMWQKKDGESNSKLRIGEYQTGLLRQEGIRP
jgi:hypothetical protein